MEVEIHFILVNASIEDRVSFIVVMDSLDHPQ
jgi:hypothetical protein